NKERARFINGLMELNKESITLYNIPFEECSKYEQGKLLNSLQEGESKGIILKIRTKIFGTTFFSTLKRLTIEGYCTSELGATNHLAYKQIPGDFYELNMLSEKQKSWATK
ncbi:MAG: gluconate 2-dehydrogenase subunit 3 family protein, partial [Flavobacteriales bacterium]|nr:gluconate 2-dehydrogenase subunit 3 family protein [Flavobacteriales bacterium]